MIKELVEEFEGQFECLEENKEKHINFSVAIKKELDSSKIITNKIKFRFMSSLLPNLVDNLYEVFILISAWIVNLVLAILCSRMTN